MPALRVLLLADTHLGFDLPQRAGGTRERRGESFFAAYERALLPALRGEVDLVVHGGDILFRSQVPPGLVLRAFLPLKRVADAGVPVVVVPGNHERSAIPYPLLAAHPGVHIIDVPRTIALEIRGMRVAVAGFPCERNEIRERFGSLLAASAALTAACDIRLLVLHQSVEGATVGPSNYVFRNGPDVLDAGSIPQGFAAVLAGHIHRHQVLTRDLRGRRMAAPVFYPGSTERTSSAENGDAKGFLILEIEPGHRGGVVRDWQFHQLAGPLAIERSDEAALPGQPWPASRTAW
jgi:exonuclease SbcD